MGTRQLPPPPPPPPLPKKKKICFPGNSLVIPQIISPWTIGAQTIAPQNN